MLENKEDTKNSFSDDAAEIDVLITPEQYEELPEWTEEMFATAAIYEGEKLIRRGRPAGSAKKKILKMRVDKDILQAFRATGKGWQTRINTALREYMQTHL